MGLPLHSSPAGVASPARSVERGKARSAVRVPSLLLLVGLVATFTLFDLYQSSRQMQPEASLDLDPAMAQLSEGVLELPPEEGCPERGAPCRFQLLLLGFHNTRTSFTSRLINLMGAYLGKRGELDIGQNNPLKWWARRDVLVINTLLMAEYTDNKTIPGLPSWLGVGFNAGEVSPADKAAFQEKAGAVVGKLNQSPPWAIKDNRLGYTAPLWLELMTHPVCVVAYRHPALTAVRLSQHPAKGRKFNLTPEWYLDNWEEYMLRVLHVCASVPTVLLPTDLAEPNTLGAFYQLLHAQLKAAGASDALRVPSRQELHEGFVQYWREADNRTARSEVLSSGSAEEQRLQRACTSRLRLPPGARLPVEAALPAPWPDGCPLRPSPLALGLVRAFDLVVHALLTTGRVVRPAVLCKELLRLAVEAAEQLGGARDAQLLPSGAAREMPAAGGARGEGLAAGGGGDARGSATVT